MPPPKHHSCTHPIFFFFSLSLSLLSLSLSAHTHFSSHQLGRSISLSQANHHSCSRFVNWNPSGFSGWRPNRSKDFRCTSCELNSSQCTSLLPLPAGWLFQVGPSKSTDAQFKSGDWSCLFTCAQFSTTKGGGRPWLLVPPRGQGGRLLQVCTTNGDPFVVSL